MQDIIFLFTTLLLVFPIEFQTINSLQILAETSSSRNSNECLTLCQKGRVGPQDVLQCPVPLSLRCFLLSQLYLCMTVRIDLIHQILGAKELLLLLKIPDYSFTTHVHRHSCLVFSGFENIKLVIVLF